MARNYFRRAAEYTTYDDDDTGESRSQCRHIHTGGNRCCSPSLRNEKFCYYHHHNRRPVKRNMAFVRQGHKSIFTIPLIDDHESIQRTISDVLQALASDEIDTRRAGLMLYGLQTASHNLSGQANKRKEQRNAVPTVDEIFDDPLDGPIAPETEWEPNAGVRDPAAELLKKWAAHEARLNAAKAAEREQGLEHTETQTHVEGPQLALVEPAA